MPGEGETNNLCTTLWNTGARPDGRHDPAQRRGRASLKRRGDTEHHARVALCAAAGYMTGWLVKRWKRR